MVDTKDLETPESRSRLWAKERATTEQRLFDYKPRDKVDAVCHDASVKAAKWAKDDGLYPERYNDSNQPLYRIQQGLRAAHVGSDSLANVVSGHV